MPKNLVLSISILLLLALTACSQSSEQVANKLMFNIKNSNHLEIQDSLSSDTYKMMAMFYGNVSNKSLKPYYRSNQLDSYTIHKIAETDKSSRFQVQLKTISGLLKKDTIDLIKEDGDWKVSNF